MSALPAHADTLTLAEAAQMMREATKDKSYQQSMLGQDAAGYLRVKRKRLTASSHRDYERGLAHFSLFFADLDLVDFERPHGTDRIEQFLDHAYGDSSARNYNKNLSILRSFFEYQVIRGRLLTDPTTPIERAKTQDVYRTTYTRDQVRMIIASADDRRDQLCARLLLTYGLRKGTLRAVRFKHFDHQRRRLTWFGKGGKVRELPIPDRHFWLDLERLILDNEAKPNDYLLCGQKTIPVGRPDSAGHRATRRYRFPVRQMGENGAHLWWYDQLIAAGIVPPGTTSGERMHKARHTAGQVILDQTGDLKLVQRVLGRSSISTTGNVYLDYDLDQIAEKLAPIVAKDHDE